MTQKEFIQRMLGNNPEMLLSCLSSTYSEGDEKGFKEDYGCSIKVATKMMAKYLNKLNGVRV